MRKFQCLTFVLYCFNIEAIYSFVCLRYIYLLLDHLHHCTFNTEISLGTWTAKQKFESSKQEART